MEIQSDTPVKFHYWLVSGHVVFTNGTDEIQSLPVTSTFATEKQELGIFQLGKAQQALQQEMFRKLGDADITNLAVLDVLLLAFTHLGAMTHDEFVAMPAGVGVKAVDELVVKGSSDEPFNPLEASRQADNVLNFSGRPTNG